MERGSEPLAGVAFGRFQVLPHRRELLADGQPIKVGGRAFDVLMALIEARGEIVGRRALMARVWPDRVVDENNLQSQIAALRAAFGAERDLIRTISGRGYQFTGEVGVPSGGSDQRAAPGMTARLARAPMTNLPAPVSELIGRGAEVAEVVSLVHAHRLVSLTGAGGIGKTQLALTAARQLLPHFTDGVWLAELSPLSDPGLVPATVAAAVGLELGGGEVLVQRVAQALADRPLLLALDTCEHVIGAAADMAEALLHANPAAHVIATSREPLKAEGEWIYPVPPLAVPAAEDDDFWSYGAAWLFILRSRASGARISEDRHAAALIATICRRLDGIPLAIELAAARSRVLGIEALAAGLDNRFRLLTGGRRMALPRHQTLRATLDWSYELLSEVERVILRRIAIFAGTFRLESARAIVASSELLQSEVVEGLANLAAKSLVAAEVDGRIVRYRLLDTTRAYAAEKLDESGEREPIARRHAGYYRDVFQRAEAEWGTRPTAEWAANYGRRIDEVRAALDWAFSPGGDASIGVALTAAAVPLWIHMSLLDECRGRVEAALRTLREDAEPARDAEMRLCAALGVSLTYTRGPTGEAELIWARALELAEAANDTDYQLRALYGHWVDRVLVCDYRAALRRAQQFGVIAGRGATTADIAVAERLMGTALHYLGDQAETRARMIRCLSAPAPANRLLQPTHYGLDQRVGAHVMLARALWLQGFPDQAISAARAGMDEAALVGHANSTCLAIADGASLIAVLAENAADIERLAALLTRHAENHLLGVWRIYGKALRGRLLMHRGVADSGATLLRTALDDLRETPLDIRYQLYLVWYAETLAASGNPARALTAIDEALQRAERTEERWYLPELLRLRGEFSRATGQTAATEAEGHFRQALEWARRQGALSWELRSAMSLTRLLRDQGRPTEAMALLEPVYGRFTEGFDTADLKAAKGLLHALR